MHADNLIEVTLLKQCDGRTRPMRGGLAPWQNQGEAVFSVSGEYHIIFEQTPEGITVVDDAKNEDGSDGEMLGYWP